MKTFTVYTLRGKELRNLISQYKNSKNPQVHLESDSDFAKKFGIEEVNLVTWLEGA